ERVDLSGRQMLTSVVRERLSVGAGAQDFLGGAVRPPLLDEELEIGAVAQIAVEDRAFAAAAFAQLARQLLPGRLDQRGLRVRPRRVGTGIALQDGATQVVEAPSVEPDDVPVIGGAELARGVRRG